MQISQKKLGICTTTWIYENHVFDIMNWVYNLSLARSIYRENSSSLLWYYDSMDPNNDLDTQMLSHFVILILRRYQYLNPNAILTPIVQVFPYHYSCCILISCTHLTQYYSAAISHSVLRILMHYFI